MALRPTVADGIKGYSGNYRGHPTSLLSMLYTGVEPYACTTRESAAN